MTRRLKLLLGFSLLPWFIFWPVAFMAFGAPGVSGSLFANLAIAAYFSYPLLYLIGLAACSVSQSERLYVIPLSSPAAFLFFYILAAITH